MEVLIAGLPASGVIVALVEGAKRLGLPAHYAPVVAVAVGLACGLVAYLIRVVPSLGGWAEAAGGGIVLGLVAAGLYSGTKAVASGQSSVDSGENSRRPLTTGD